MSDSGLSVVCRTCGRKVKMEQVKFDDVRKAYVCENCFVVTHTVKKHANSFVDDTERSINSLKNKLVKITCTACNYHFTRQKDKEIRSCPYCGSNKIEVLRTGADKIISESDYI
jgi:protein-arginine kinase activator protein McsA